jgi:eukaryotic-like serine/threonine-protein kinase
VMDRLGTGAMGAVYRARDPHLGRDVAIKVLARPADGATGHLSLHQTLDLRGGTAAGELLAEAQMMARLSHPNLLPIYEVGLAGDELFLVMEYIAGADLRSWLGHSRSTQAMVEVFAQAARGLAAAHAHGIVHGDFKPENVLVGDDGRVRVADFGLARLGTQVTAPIRVEPTIVGTPFYMAPELWSGGGPTAAADVFALCTALAEAFGAPDPEQIDRTLRVRGLSRRLRDAIERGLAEEPRARPTMDALLAALTADPVVRRRWPVAMAVLVAAGAGAALLLPRGEAECQAGRVRFADRWDGPGRAQLEASGAAAEVDRLRGMLNGALGQVCEAERRGELSAIQARSRTSCVERRGLELDAIATRIAAERLPPDRAKEATDGLVTIKECLDMDAPPLPAERAPIAALYRRLIAATGSRWESRRRAAEFAAIEKEAHARGERELEGRAASLLGMRQIEIDELTAADASFARAYDLATAIKAPDLALEALVERSVVAEKHGNPVAAHTYSKLAFELVNKIDAPEGKRIYATYSLARSLLRMGQPGPAIERVDEALELGPEEAWLQVILRQIKIEALKQLGQHEKALALARETAEISRKEVGDRDPDYGIALNVIASALNDTGDVEGALDYRRRALAVMASGLPAEHSMVIIQRTLVARDLAATGRFQEAITEDTAVLEIVDRNESTRAERAGIIADLGTITFWSGRFEQGLHLLEEGLDGMISQYGQDHPDVLQYRAARVELELELGKLDEAERHIDALERSYRARNDQGTALARLQGLYRAQLARAGKDPRKAETLIRAALAGIVELKGSEEDREDLLRTLGASLVDQGRWSEALETLTAATNVARSRHALEDRRALIDLERVRALAGAGRRSEAETLAKEIRETFRRFPGHPRARAALDALSAGRPP